MQIFVKSFGGVRLYFSGEGKEGERLSRGIPLFCKRDIARRMQASSQLPPEWALFTGGDRQYARIQLPMHRRRFDSDKPLLLNTTIRDYTLHALAPSLVIDFYKLILGNKSLQSPDKRIQL